MVYFAAIIILTYTLLVFYLIIGINRQGDMLQSDAHNNFTVIIPFHNEENRIDSLIKSLNDCNVPKEIDLLFIDDHSTDNTVSKIENELTCDYRLERNSGSKGKKYALKEGVLFAKNESILTLDADVSFQPDFLENIVKIEANGMVVLPVKSVSKGLIGKLADIEFTFLQVITIGFIGWNNPILCNGANLIFRKSDFIKIDKARKDYNVQSGDDIFLLDQFKKHHVSIRAINKQSLSVTTQHSDRLLSLLQQRRRWIGKMTYLPSLGTILGGLFIIILHFMMIYLFFNLFSVSLIYGLFVLKVLMDVILLFVGRNIKGDSILMLILFQFWYPAYLVSMLFPMQREKKWARKG